MLLTIMMLVGGGFIWGATPYIMSTGNYSESFDDIANWTSDFASGIGAGYWASVANNPMGTTGDGIKTSYTTNTFKTSTSGGVQKGSTNIYLLSTSTANACAIDLLLDFTARNAGTISFDVATVFNSGGDRDSKLKLFYSTDGTTFTELTGTNLPFTARNNVALSVSITTIALPAAFNNSATARLRFYEYSTALGATPTGSQPKISIDNIVVTSTAALSTPAVSTTSVTSILSNGATFNGDITADNSASILDRGFSYKTSTGVILTDNQTAEGGTTIGTYSKVFTGLSVNTQYFYKAYATNSEGTTLSDTEIHFYTLANVPDPPTVNNATPTTLDVAVNINENPATTEFAIQETGDSYVQTDGSLNTTAVWQTAATWGTKTVTGLAQNKSYTFNVKARNGDNTETLFGATATLSTSISSSPILSVGTIAAFSSTQCLNSTGGPNGFTITGSNLTTSDVTVAALSGFSYSTTSDGTYTATLTYTQAGGDFSQTVYVKFTPTAIQSYSGNIVVSGGGATSVNRSVSGSGIDIAPSVTTTTPATNITATTVTMSGDVTDGGCQTISARSICYGIALNPDLSGTYSTESGTTGTFSSNIASLEPNTLYHFRAYATSTAGTSYGTDGTFWTLSNPPTTQASNLTGTLTYATNANISWTAATFPESGATTKGYLLLRAESPNSPGLVNGNGAAPVGNVNTSIYYSMSEFDVSMSNTLAASKTYNFVLIPFCWDGTNAATYNYLTASAPGCSVTSPSNFSDVVAVASSESATISSLINDVAPLTSSTGVQVWQITVRDGGVDMNDTDNLPTIVTGLTLSQNPGNAIDNWLDAIKTISIFDGTTWIADATSITATTIVFSGLSINVADNTSKTLSLRLSLNATLNNAGTGNLDGDDFVFRLSSTNFLNDGTCSTKASFSTVLSTDGQNVVSIVATKLAFVQQPSSVLVNNSITPSVTVKAADAGGNVDIDYVSIIDVTVTGSTLTASPVSVEAITGVSTFSSLQFETVGTGVTLSATSGSLTGATSTIFDVTSSLGSYSYRTLRSGDWNGVASDNEIWERSSDGGSSWATVTSSGDLPNSTASTITVGTGHTITISSSVNADQLTIEATGQITINSGQTFTINDGSGTDAIIAGKLKNSGTLINNGQLTFSTGSTYEHAINGGVIPIATWNTASTIEVSGTTATVPTFDASTTYGNVTWNCSGQSTTLNLLGTLLNITGNLSINTNGKALRLVNSPDVTVTIGGNLVISGGILNFGSGLTNTGCVLNVGGWNQTGGTFSPNTSTNSFAINFTGANGSFIKSGGSITNSYINWTINSGASLTLLNDLSVAIGRSLIVNGTLDCASSMVSGEGTFTLASGATLKTASETGVSGSIILTGTKTLNAGANYIFNGGSAQTIGTLVTTANNVEINNAAGVNIDGNMTLSTLTIDPAAILNVNEGKQLTVSTTLTNNGTLNLLSTDADGTATILTGNTENISGTFNVSQYLSGSTTRNWYVSSPVSNAIIPLTPADNLYAKYDEAAVDWTYPALGDPFVPGEGYIAHIVTSPQTFTFATNSGGALNSGNQPISLSFAGATKTGFNLVGNPYPSYINWSETLANSANALTTVWYRTQETGIFSFYTYNATGGIGLPSDITGKIPPMQAFWVKAVAADGILTFTNSIRSHADGSNRFLAPAEKTNIQQVLYLQVSNGTNNDETVIMFNPNASNEFDNYDSPKMSNENAAIPEIFTRIGDENLAINGLNSLTPNEEMPLGFTTGTANNTFTIKATKVSNFNIDTKIILKDNLLNTEMDITDGTAYSFSSDVTNTTSRFTVIFRTVGIYTGLDENMNNKPAINIFKNATGQIMILRNDVNGQQGMVTVCNAVGQKLFSTATTGTSTVIYNSFPTGVYFITVNIDGKNTLKKVIIN